jgi:hypothetical protein
LRGNPGSIASKGTELVSDERHAISQMKKPLLNVDKPTDRFDRFVSSLLRVLERERQSHPLSQSHPASKDSDGAQHNVDTGREDR